MAAAPQKIVIKVGGQLSVTNLFQYLPCALYGLKRSLISNVSSGFRRLKLCRLVQRLPKIGENIITMLDP